MVQENPTSDVLKALAMGPFKRVRTWSHIFANGFNFQTLDYGKNKSTMNYGVCVSSEDEGEYFGIIENIIELVYTGSKKEYKTVLFKCSWMDSIRGMNIHERYKLVEVNHTKKYPKYDPFILSYQASQVYFASYPSLKKDRVQWWAVFKTRARSVVDAPVDLEFLQEPINEGPSLCAPNDIPDYDIGDESEDDEDDEMVEGDDSDESSIATSDSEGYEDDDEDDDLFLQDSSDSDPSSSDEDSI